MPKPFLLILHPLGFAAAYVAELGIMYVSAWIAWCRPGGSTCLSAAAVAVRGRTGSAGAGATQPRRSRRGGAGGGGAGRARGDRRDFAKGLFEGTFRRDFAKGLSKGFNIYNKTWFQ